MPRSFPIFSGLHFVPYARVTGLLGYTIAPALRVLAQSSIGASPRLEGSGAAPSITQVPVVGIEAGLEVSYDGVSMLVTAGWSSADVFDYGPRASMVLRGQLGDGPGSGARVRAERCREATRQRLRDRTLARPFSPREDRADAYSRSPATEAPAAEDPCPAPE